MLFFEDHLKGHETWEIVKSKKHCSYEHLANKVKCTLVQALRLCTGHMAPRGSRGIAILFYDHWH